MQAHFRKRCCKACTLQALLKACESKEALTSWLSADYARLSCWRRPELRLECRFQVEVFKARLIVVRMPGSAAGAAHGAARAAARHRRRPGRLGGALRRGAAVRQRARTQSGCLGQRARARCARRLRWGGGWRSARSGAPGQLRRGPGCGSLAGRRRVAEQAAQGGARPLSQTPCCSLTSVGSRAGLLLLLLAPDMSGRAQRVKAAGFVSSWQLDP